MSSDKLSIQEQVEYLIKTADFYIERFDGRREFEWKVTLGLWGVLLGSIVVSGDLAGKFPIGLLIFLGLVMVGAHWYWLWSVWRAHRTDKDYAFTFSGKAADLLDVELPPFRRKDLFGKIPPAMAFQLLVTIVLVTLVTVFFSGSLDPQKESGVLMQLPLGLGGVDWARVMEQFLATISALAVAVIGILITHRLQKKRDKDKANKEADEREDYEQRLAALGVARGAAVEIRNFGEDATLIGEELDNLMSRALEAEQEMERRAAEVSEAKGSLVTWQDRVPGGLPYDWIEDDRQRQMLWNLSGAIIRAETVIVMSYRR